MGRRIPFVLLVALGAAACATPNSQMASTPRADDVSYSWDQVQSGDMFTWRLAPGVPFQMGPASGSGGFDHRTFSTGTWETTTIDGKQATLITYATKRSRCDTTVAISIPNVRRNLSPAFLEALAKQSRRFSVRELRESIGERGTLAMSACVQGPEAAETVKSSFRTIRFLEPR